VGVLQRKRRRSGCTSALKVKCPDWNLDRHKLFRDRPSPSRGEAQQTKKREEIARMIEQLRTPGLRQGIARELHKQIAILEREIAELEQA
jgi:hypothetical protein